MSESQILKRGRKTLETEIEGLRCIAQRLDQSFEDAVLCLLKCKGKVIVTGVGKSGVIGQKIAATFSSTGTPALFLHSGEAVHGDLGVISQSDVLIALSFSGETEEVLQILAPVQNIGIPLIGICSGEQTTLAKNCDIVLDVSIPQEACPLGLAPTTSSTATLAMGDALAMCLLELRHFSKEDFALFHPGGSLGKKLTLRVKDVMISGEQLPLIPEQTLMKDAVQVLSEKMLGLLIAVNEHHQLSGVFSVGDLMRLVNQGMTFHDKPLAQFISPNPKTIASDSLAARALHLMETHSITCLVVTSNSNIPIGIVQIYHILRSGVF